MKIGIIGAGFTGLSAAYYLSRKGHNVTLFEKAKSPGGLAIGYKEHEWDWTLEEHYHHWFTNDKSVLSLAKEISHEVIIKRPKTSSFVDDRIFQLDSPLSLLLFSRISFISRIRMGIAIALLRYNPFWKPLEQFTAEPFLRGVMGKEAYRAVWEPLMVNKLGNYSSIVSLAWFWARVYKRTPSLAYPKGGFLNFAKDLEKKIKEKGGKFFYNVEVTKIESKENTVVHFTENEIAKTMEFDKIIVTLPLFLFSKITPQLPDSYKKTYSSLKGLGAVNIVIRLKEQFFPDNTYWLNMCDIDSPILAVVEHTNFMNKSHYNNEHLLYVGNYMDPTDKRYGMTKEELLELYDPWLRRINPHYKDAIISSTLFKAPFAQPIIPKNYSKNIPPLHTPLNNIFLSNIQQVYPWDRGTNYAVELGKKVADLIAH